MKKLKFTTKTAIALYAMLAVVLFTGCTNGNADGSKYDKLILTDPNTGKQYLMKHSIGDTYMIDEKVIKISGKDTVSVFE